MAHADLHAFLDVLEKRRELVRVREPVNVDLEISAVTDRVSKLPGGGPALLFEKPEGYDMPVLINSLGSLSRMKLALEVDVHRLAHAHQLPPLFKDLEESAQVGVRHGPLLRTCRRRPSSCLRLCPMS